MSKVSKGVHDPDYSYLNGLAHNRTVTWVRALALVCHIGFWNPGGQGATDRTAWRATIDHALAQSISMLQNTKLTVRYDFDVEKYFVFFGGVSKIGDPTNIMDPATALKFANKSLQAHIHSMIDDDRRTLNIYCDSKEFKFSSKFQVHSEYFTVTYFIDLSPAFFNEKGRGSDLKAILGDSSLIDDLNRYASAIRKNCNSFVDDSQVIENKEIADFFFRRYWEIIFGFFPTDLSPAEGATNIGHVFANFRGIILSDETVRLPVEALTKKSTLSWGQRATEIFGPIVSDDNRSETTSSYMLDGRAFYITSLGYSNSKKVLPDRTAPLTYLMYVHQTPPGDNTKEVVNKWQLGRLIDRLLNLGTVRLAALVELRELRTAGEIIAELEPLTKEARNSLNNGKESEATQQILALNKKINNLGIRNGIQYRVERSRYYVEQFRSGLAGLRLHRIEGFQPYNRFVEQRLGSTFDFIDRLGLRYERAATSLARLAQDGLQLQLNNIQKAGEQFILLFLLPYYSGLLLDHVIDDMSWKGFAIVWSFWAGCCATKLAAVDRVHKLFKKNNYRYPNLISVYLANVFVFILAVGVFYIGLNILHFALTDKDTKCLSFHEQLFDSCSHRYQTEAKHSASSNSTNN
ncbi:DUF3422 family protein [Beijerinckia sp. L45]|uniref:DUF3422 family protein n=1 Tax=Beijerinckia sp. L45 TaxID=1641855 RepID=UPI00131CB00A|nr:DUF3422 family protein [Beijerinckia sp. L45]